MLNVVTSAYELRGILSSSEKVFPVKVLKSPAGSLKSVPSGSGTPWKLYVLGPRLCLASSAPPAPRILATWNLTQLRRYGLVDGKFVFEAGTRCGKSKCLELSDGEFVEIIGNHA